MSMAWFKEWEAFVKAKTDSELLCLFRPSPFTALHCFNVCVWGVGGGGEGGWRVGVHAFVHVCVLV